MKNSLFTLVLCSCFFYACNNVTETSNSDAIIAADTSLQNSMPAISASPDQMMTVDSGTSSAITGTPVMTPTTTSQPASPTAKGMNPPHGEPGHRCEIAVGAPLDSPPNAAPAKNAPPTPTTQSSPIATPITASPAVQTPAVTAPGMNPPHGQPGHDCAIAVGAPLKK